MQQRNKLFKKILSIGKDENFLSVVHFVENLVSKVLSLVLLLIILISVVDLIIFIAKDIFADPIGFFNKTLIELFGLFLNILIALELLENITVYLKKHVFPVELVIATSLIAIARKIIIFDLEKYSSTDLIALSLGILALAISYWLINRLDVSTRPIAKITSRLKSLEEEIKHNSFFHSSDSSQNLPKISVNQQLYDDNNSDKIEYLSILQHEYRQKYLEEKQKVIQNQSNIQLSNFMIDIAIASNLQRNSIGSQEIRRILSQSDLLYELRETVGKNTYRLEAIKYINLVESQVAEI